MRFVLLIDLLAVASASMASDFAKFGPSQLASPFEDDHKNTAGLRGPRGLERHVHKGSKPDKLAPPRPGGPSYEPQQQEAEEEYYPDVVDSLPTTTTPLSGASYKRRKPKFAPVKPEKTGPRGRGRGRGRPAPPGRPGEQFETLAEEEYYEEEESPPTPPVARGWEADPKEKKGRGKHRGQPKKQNGSVARPPPSRVRPGSAAGRGSIAQEMADRINAPIKKSKPRKENFMISYDSPDEAPGGRMKPTKEKFKPEKVKLEKAKEEKFKPEKVKPGKDQKKKDDDKRFKGKQKAPKMNDGKRWGPPGEAASNGSAPTPAPTFHSPTAPPSPGPTTDGPTTSEPTTGEPTTSEPTTSEPTTSEPTTSEPTTDAEEMATVPYPTLYPTLSPTFTDDDELGSEITTLLPPCPPPYDRTIEDYVAGDAIEMNTHVFVCRRPPYEEYCNEPDKDEGWNETVKQLWFDAWDHRGPCEVTDDVEDVDDVEHVEAMSAPAMLVGEEAALVEFTTTSMTKYPVDAIVGELIGQEAAILDAISTTTTNAPIVTTEDLTTTTEAPTTTTEATATTTTTTTTTTRTTTTTEGFITSTALAEVTAPSPAGYPTYMPTEEMPECPPAYDHYTTYAAGDVVEVSEHIFRCRDEVHALWCNIPELDSAYEGDPNAKQMWNDAWVHVGPCDPVTLEELMDMEALVEEIKADGEFLAADGSAGTLATMMASDGDTDCTRELCSLELTHGTSLNYRVNITEGTLSAEIVHEGESWLGLAFSDDGGMVGSNAVIGIPEKNSVQKFNLGGKEIGSVELADRQTLTDASIQIAEGQTIMKFTKILDEDGEVEILAGAGDMKNIMLFAHGSGVSLGYHGPDARMAFELTL